MEMVKSKAASCVIAALISFVVALPGVGMPAFEKAFADEPGKNPTFVLAGLAAAAGERVDVELRVDNNPGILGATIVVTYDDGLVLRDVANGEAFLPLSMTKPAQYESGCKIHWDAADIDSRDVKDGVIATLSFDVAADAVNGNHVIQVKADKSNGSIDVYDYDLTTVAIESATCNIAVSGGADPAPVSVNVSTIVNGQGQVTGGGKYAVGSDATLVANAAEGWRFEGFYVNGESVSTVSPYTFTAKSDVEIEAVFNNAVVSAVSEAIAELPDADSITLANKADIEKAYENYRELSDDQKAAISDADKAKLQALIEKIASLEAASSVESLIAGLPGIDAVSLSDKASVEAALAKYDALNAAQRGYVATGAIDKLMALKSKIAELEKSARNPEKTDPTVKPSKKANTMKVSVVKKSIKAKSLKKTKKKVKAIKVKNAKGKLTYKKVSGSKKLSVNKKTGKIVIKKGTKKGTYKVKVKIIAAGNSNYKKASITKVVKVKVR